MASAWKYVGIAHSRDNLVEVFLLQAEANEFAPESRWQGRQEKHSSEDQSRPLALDPCRERLAHGSGHVSNHAGENIIVLIDSEVSIRKHSRLIAELIL